MMIKFFVLFYFYLFFAISLEPVLKRWGSESIREAYNSIIMASQSSNDIAAEGHDLDPLQVAEKLFKTREEERKVKRKAKLQKSQENRRDIERGELGSASSRNEVTGTQSQG